MGGDCTGTDCKSAPSGNVGEVTQDLEGRQIMRVLGKNMVWLLKMKEVSKGLVEEPLAEQKVAMHFIR
ncbi:MAG: hypothetical protein AAB347_07450 [Bacteroidota bacterium]